MRRLLIFAFAGLLASSIASAGPQAFVAAKPEPADGVDPRSFSFSLSTWRCVVSALGAGDCRDARQRWRFRLPVEDGRIDSLDIHAGETFVFVYSLTDEESSWGKAVGFVSRARRPQWAIQVGGLNRAVPLAAEDSLLLAALGFVASVERRTGEFRWRHDFVYDGSGRTDVTVGVVGDVVLLRNAVPWRPDDLVTVCYALETGIVVPCPRDRPPP